MGWYAFLICERGIVFCPQALLPLMWETFTVITKLPPCCFFPSGILSTDVKLPPHYISLQIYAEWSQNHDEESLFSSSELMCMKWMRLATILVWLNEDLDFIPLELIKLHLPREPTTSYVVFLVIATKEWKLQSMLIKLLMYNTLE